MIEKINESEIEEIARQSRTGKYGLSRKDISGALETEGQPFEVEWVRLPPGKINFPCSRASGTVGILYCTPRPGHRAPK